MGSNLSLQRIPTETVVEILLFLGEKDILAALALNHHTRDVVAQNAKIQFYLALSSSGLVEPSVNVACAETYPEATKRILEHRCAWSVGSFMNNRAPHKLAGIEAPPRTIVVYRGGLLIVPETIRIRQTFFTGTRETRTLNIYDLVNANPSTPSSESFRVGKALSPTKFPPFTCSQGETMIGFTVDRRNDVLAAVTLRDSLTNSNTNGMRQFELKFYARQLSTGQAHPLAGESAVLLLEGTVPAPEHRLLRCVEVTMDVLGENILVLVHWKSEGNMQVLHDKLIFFSWVDGTILSLDKAFRNTWSGYTLLSPSVILLANRRLELLELVMLPPARRPDVRHVLPAREDTSLQCFASLMVLGLPQTIRDGHSMLHITCNSSPDFYLPLNPHDSSSLAKGSLAEDPTCSLVQINLRFSDAFHGDFAYGCVTHRSSLLSFTTNKRRNLSDPTAYERASGPLFPPNPEGSSITSFFKRNGKKYSRGPALWIDWEDWGPDLTHWYEIDEEAVLNRACHGQTMLAYDGVTKHIVKWDFNPYSVAKTKEELSTSSVKVKRSRKVRTRSGQSKRVSTKSILHGETWFVHPIESSLPFVETKHPHGGKPGSQALYFDENMVIGETEDYLERCTFEVFPVRDL